MGYKVGDMVVYPRHGAAKVEAITERTVKGVTREYLQLSVLSSDGLVINVPVDNAKKVGVRDIVDANEVAKVFEILRTPIIEKEMNWSRRYKLNVEKIATGDVNKIAEVVRDLAQRDVDEHGLSAGEKRMLTKARSILTSEISLSEHLEEGEAQRLLDVNLGYEAPQPGDDPWNQPQSQTPASSVPQTVSGNMSGDDPWNQPQSVPQPAAGDDPWNQPQAVPQSAPQATPHGDPWNQPQPAQPTPNADPWNSQPQPQPKPQPQVAAEDDEYSMSDQSLGEATAMNLDDLKKLFEVKKVEQFAADDPKNPKNIQPAKKHSDE